MEQLKVGTGSRTRNCLAKGKVKGTFGSLVVRLRSGFLSPPRSYRSPYWDRGARIPDCILGVWEKTRIWGQNHSLGK